MTPQAPASIPSSSHFAGRARRVLLALVAGSLAALPAAAQQRSELDDRIRALEEQLGAMQSELRQLRAEAAEREEAEQELEQAVDALADESEKRRLGGVIGAVPTESRYGLGPAASKVYAAEEGVSIGGYGEVLLQDFDATRDDGSRSSKKDEFDTLRNVLYFGYKFNERILFNSEIEWEHASTSKEGSVSVEFAYLDFLLHDAANIRAGNVLVPVGFLNELHEPPIFLGARRPEVERNVIPSTWRENGVGLFGDVGIFSYRAYVLAGLEAADFSASSGLRGGRQKGSNSLAEDMALALRFDFEPVPGLTLGASGYFGDSGQDVTLDGEELDVSTDLVELHADYRWRGLQLRGLWTQVDLGDVAELNELLDLEGMDTIGSRMEGWYGEVGYDVLAHRPTEQELIPFVRWEEYDTHAEVPEGFMRDPALDREVLTLGLSYKPHPKVVIKLDWQDIDNAAGTGNDQLNLAFGWLF